MNNEQLLRYSRHILLPQCDVTGQEKLLAAHALVIGLGGLGSPVALYLAAAGVGELTFVDFDTVEVSNLQRQIAHQTQDCGTSKVESAKQSALALNPDTKINVINKKINDAELQSLVAKADVVLDCTDNFSTRFAINQYCVIESTALVSGAAIRMDGQVSVFNQQQSSPCYHCLYKDQGDVEQRCSDNGILAPVVGIIGCIQATEAIKVLTGIGNTLDSRVLILDASNMEWRSIKLKKDPACPVCQK
ncbi:Molybdopterin-synthase adenylyltransferase [hydrothermal vent metagenome]|uniref:Molybdopterin-synthase adenylyltransferase n=1 Tax=hydrothermal vent metagenome TaxID=652676 RepID=A0A3B0ZR53_9ZZZZ